MFPRSQGLEDSIEPLSPPIGEQRRVQTFAADDVCGKRDFYAARKCGVPLRQMPRAGLVLKLTALRFTVTLAKELAQKAEDQGRSKSLSHNESLLQSSLLAKEDTYCHDSLTNAERDWLREHRTPEAQKWNILSDLNVEQLTHDTS